jgi:hypothetical protein
VWNRLEGVMGDLALFYVTGLALAYNSAARQSKTSQSIALLRSCFGFGSNFEFDQAESEFGFHDFIVGEVTVHLARLLEAAQPRQFLIGDHFRIVDETEPEIFAMTGSGAIDTLLFVALAQSRIPKLHGISIGNGAIASVRTYLTGTKKSDREFTVKKYTVADKHGIEHRFFNAKFNVASTIDDNIHVGLMDRELAQFDSLQTTTEELSLRVA